MTPVWIFPAYPLLLNATFATNLIATDRVGPDDPRNNRLAIATTALTTQGTGFLISFMICAAFIYRLMTQKLPRDMQRPGVVRMRLPSPPNRAWLIRVVHFYRSAGVYCRGIRYGMFLALNLLSISLQTFYPPCSPQVIVR